MQYFDTHLGERTSSTIFACFFVAGLALISTSSTRASTDEWFSSVSAQTSSPVETIPGDYLTSWTAPDGRTIRLSIRAPRTSDGAPTVVLPEIPEGADARPFFDVALGRARSLKASKLLIPKATYVFKTISPKGQGHLLIEGVSDLTIDGQGATFVFSTNKAGIYLTQSQRLRLHNINIEYSLNMASIGTIKSTSGSTFLEIDPSHLANANDAIGHLAEYDINSRRKIVGGTRFYFPAGSSNAPRLVSDRSYTSTAFNNPTLIGKTFLVFHHFYGGNAIQIQDSPGTRQAEDIWLDHVNIHSGPGMAIFVYGLKRGLAIWNSAIAPKPGARISSEYDAVHILLAGGDISIKSNDISGQGDDGINLNSPVHPIVRVDESGLNLVLSTYSRFISPNDTLAFFNDKNQFLGFAKVTDQPLKPLGGLNNQHNGLRIDHKIEGLSESSIVRDLSLMNSRVEISKNTIESGILLQTPNSVISHNYIKGTVTSPIRLITNTGYFKEGAGAVNVTVNNNKIENALGGTINDGAISTYGSTRAGLSSFPVNKNINIVENEIFGSPQGCITVASSDKVTVARNRCIDTNSKTPGKASINVTKSNFVLLEHNARFGATTGGISIDSDSLKNTQRQEDY